MSEVYYIMDTLGSLKLSLKMEHGMLILLAVAKVLVSVYIGLQ